MPRLAVAGYVHEANSFSILPTDLEEFARRGIIRGSGLGRPAQRDGTMLTGYLEAASASGYDVDVLLYTESQPGGPMTARAYDDLTSEILQKLAAGRPWAGVLLALHGAAVADGHPDADGEFVAAVRAVVGPHVPIGVTLDLHANLSGRLADAATVIVGFRTNPHLDPRERARECADVVMATAERRVAPRLAHQRIPIAVNILRMGTDEEPMRSLMDALDEVVATPGVLSASLFEGFPYADVPHMGMAGVVVHDGSADAARELCDHLSTTAWNARADLRGSAAAVEDALGQPVGSTPTVLLDVGDNVGGGSTGDSVVLLAAAMRRGAGPVAQTIHDPDAVRRCIDAGVGSMLSIDVGSTFDRRFGPSVTVRGAVESLTDGSWEDDGPVHGGASRFSAGPTVHLRTARGDALLLTSRIASAFSAGQYASVGVDLRSFALIVGKGVHGPRASLRSATGTFIAVDTPGPTAASLEALPYRRRGAVWPLDPLTDWAPGDNGREPA